MAKGDRHIEWAICVAICIFFSARTALASADEVNVARGMAQDGPGMKGQFNLDIGWITGNTDLTQVKAGTSVGYEAGPHNVMLSLNGAYAESMTNTVAKQVASHFHYRHRLLDNLATEVFTNYLYDQFAGIDTRLSTGYDIVFLFELDALRVDLGVGYMVQYENYGIATGIPDDFDDDWAGRAQTYIFIKYTIAQNVEFVEHAFYMPRLDFPGPIKDYMIVSATSLAVKLNPILMYQSSFNLSFDEPPPLHTKALNTELMAGLALKF